MKNGLRKKDLLKNIALELFASTLLKSTLPKAG